MTDEKKQQIEALEAEIEALESQIAKKRSQIIESYTPEELAKAMDGMGDEEDPDYLTEDIFNQKH